MAKTPRTRALATFGLNVRKRREALDLSQVDAAESCELDPTYISGIERGVRNPSLVSIASIAKGLKTTVSELCTGVKA
jgi:transcriptional regulator with XRE-family HTH domain